MREDKRKKPRRAMHYPAWINQAPGGDKQTCLVTDVSETGARLQIASPDTIPESFLLQLGNERAPNRQCRVVWRHDGEIGIHFERPNAHPRQKS